MLYTKLLFISYSLKRDVAFKFMIGFADVLLLNNDMFLKDKLIDSMCIAKQKGFFLVFLSYE